MDSVTDRVCVCSAGRQRPMLAPLGQGPFIDRPAEPAPQAQPAPQQPAAQERDKHDVLKATCRSTMFQSSIPTPLAQRTSSEPALVKPNPAPPSGSAQRPSMGSGMRSGCDPLLQPDCCWSCWHATRTLASLRARLFLAPSLKCRPVIDSRRWFC